MDANSSNSNPSSSSSSSSSSQFPFLSNSTPTSTSTPSSSSASQVIHGQHHPASPSPSPDFDPYDSDEYEFDFSSDFDHFDPYDFENDRIAYPNLPPGLGSFGPFSIPSSSGSSDSGGIPFPNHNPYTYMNMGFVHTPTPNPNPSSTGTPPITVNTNVNTNTYTNPHTRNRLSRISERSEWSISTTSSTRTRTRSRSSSIVSVELEVSPTSTTVSIHDHDHPVPPSVSSPGSLLPGLGTRPSQSQRSRAASASTSTLSVASTSSSSSSAFSAAALGLRFGSGALALVSASPAPSVASTITLNVVPPGLEGLGYRSGPGYGSASWAGSSASGSGDTRSSLGHAEGETEMIQLERRSEDPGLDSGVRFGDRDGDDAAGQISLSSTRDQPAPVSYLYPLQSASETETVPVQAAEAVPAAASGLTHSNSNSNLRSRSSDSEGVGVGVGFGILEVRNGDEEELDSYSLRLRREEAEAEAEGAYSYKRRRGSEESGNGVGIGMGSRKGKEKKENLKTDEVDVSVQPVEDQDFASEMDHSTMTTTIGSGTLGGDSTLGSASAATNTHIKARRISRMILGGGRDRGRGRGRDRGMGIHEDATATATVLSSSGASDVIFDPSSSNWPCRTGERKSISFWLSFFAINLSIFISAMSFMALGTVVPTIARALQDGQGDFTWIGSAYALCMTCSIPLGGSLSDTFGRKSVLLGCLVCFAVGSALAGGAKSMVEIEMETGTGNCQGNATYLMAMMIAGQAIQGIGGGGMISLTPTIIQSDLGLATSALTASEPSRYQGILGLTWSVASAVAPVIGGAFASSNRTTWRWLFYLNLPLTGIAGVLIAICLRGSPSHSRANSTIKPTPVEWSPTALLTITSALGCGLTTIGLAFGGVRFPWDSAQVLVPLVLGAVVLIGFGVFAVCANRGVHVQTRLFEAFGNRTTIGGLICVGAHGVASIAFAFYMPIYFQAVLGFSPLHSAVNYLAGVLPMVFAAFLAGIFVTRSGYYRLPIYAGWILIMVGFGLLSTLDEASKVGEWVGYQVITGLGAGILFSTPGFSVVSPLPANRIAAALLFSNFIRAFAQTWGITVGSTILQNLFHEKLPASSQFPLVDSHLVAFAGIPTILDLPDPLKTEVQVTFAHSFAVIWQTMVGVCGMGLLGTFLIQKMQSQNEDKMGAVVNGRNPVKGSHLDETSPNHGHDPEMGYRPMEMSQRRNDGG
ncbi:hypothetical protein D9758_016074 [Tetrapyrgos nigripes]|uniref:Major facilitator superfamily (MFS) profile domain-containing protein n=1 Tax=Tetrapyrgos nigripes TaxID=182062 RepID=A0A8H5C351_9AGAR|nr:hypothetical protein D9758_016074 [Tetrapyrgos nigripes]